MTYRYGYVGTVRSYACCDVNECNDFCDDEYTGFASNTCNNGCTWMETHASDCTAPLDAIGNMNGDTALNILDVFLIVNIIVNEDPYNSAADLNDDNSNDVLDAVRLINMIVTRR